MQLRKALNFTTGLLSGGSDLSLDNFFASFAPLAGSTLIDIQVATVPFANQQVAANAIINQGLMISLKMTCPARGPAGFAAKLATISALQASLKLHTNSGGTFTVLTPAFPYLNCLLTKLQDVSAGQPSQPQSIYQWDFYQPLLSLAQAQGAMNSMMAKINAGVPSTGALSGGGVSVGSQLSLATPSVAPSSSNLAAANLAGGVSPL